MRYISADPNLHLYYDNGKIAYSFAPNGILDLGTGNTIDASDVAGSVQDLMLPYRTDLSGRTVAVSGYQRIEMAGQGDLINYDPPQLGWNRMFFEAPLKTGRDTVSSKVGIIYTVVSGTVTYKGVTYSKNDCFVTDGSTTETSGTGQFSLEIPMAIRQKVDQQYKENFKIKHLNNGDELVGYFGFTNGGFDPRNSLLTSSNDWFSHVNTNTSNP